jgi:hypothetical protein
MRLATRLLTIHRERSNFTLRNDNRMDYLENQMLLKSCYDPQVRNITIPGSGSRIVNCDFRSVIRPCHESEDTSLSASGHADLLLRSFEGNYNFTYPVFMPGGTEMASGAIIMLHGLNERNWQKYLYWAQYLGERTGKAVVLFPMAFHINRSPDNWSDPRAMQEVARQRALQDPQNAAATPLNAALSTRLDLHPEWFCTSGLQSCYDLISLTQQISSGCHPLFRKATSVDFFAYSVGAFLLEVLLIANPGGIYSGSKSVLFLGGSSFGQMKGISRYIMDAKAFDSLEEAFIRKDPREVKQKINIEYLNTFNDLWSAFMSLLRLDRCQAHRERSFHRLRNQISAIGLSGDRVIPAKSILQTLWGESNRNKIPMAILDFPYPYAHENPFPLSHPEFRIQVDQAFREVFTRAVRFLG